MFRERLRTLALALNLPMASQFVSNYKYHTHYYSKAFSSFEINVGLAFSSFKLDVASSSSPFPAVSAIILVLFYSC